MKQGRPVTVSNGKLTTFYLSESDRNAIRDLKRRLGLSTMTDVIRELLKEAERQYQ